MLKNKQYSSLNKDLAHSNPEGYKRFILDNGLIVILKQNSKIPLISYSLHAKTGSMDESKHLGSGLSHYFEHLLGVRSTKPNSKVNFFYDTLSNIGALRINAYTSHTNTAYYATVHKQHLQKVIENLEELIGHSIFLKEDSESEIQVILKEYNLRKVDSIEGILYDKYYEMMFSQNPIKHPVIGYPEILLELSEKETMDYFKDKYAPNNLVLVLVGDIHLMETEEIIRNTFKNLKRKSIFPSIIENEVQQDSPRKDKIFINSDSYTVLWGFPMFENISIKHYIITDILQKMFLSKSYPLYKSYKIDDNKIWDMDMWYDMTRYNIGSWVFEFKLTPEQFKNWDQIQEILFNNLINFPNTPKADFILSNIKNKLLLDHEEFLENNHDVADKLALLEINTGFANDLFRYKNVLQSITLEDLKSFINKHFQLNKLNVLVGIPQFLESQDQNSNNLKDQKANDKNGFFYKINSIVLKNGIQLIYNKDPNAKINHFAFAFKTGKIYNSLEESEYNSFLPILLQKGTKKFSEIELSEAIEQLGKLSTYHGNSYFSISGSALENNFSDLFNLALEIAFNGNPNENDFQKVQQDILNLTLKDEENIMYLTSTLILEHLFPKEEDRYNHSASKERIQNSTLKEFLSFYKKYVNPKNMIVAIDGNFDKDQVIQSLENFSTTDYDISSKSIVAHPTNIAINQISTKEESMEKINIQSMVNIGFIGPNIHDKKEYLLTLILKTFFSNMSNPFFLKIRGAGLAYSTGLRINQIDETLFLFLYALTEKSKNETVKKMMLDIIKEFVETIDEKEFEKYKSTLQNHFIEENSTVKKQIANVISKSILNIKDPTADYIDMLKDIQFNDFEEFLKKYITLDKYKITIVNPKN